MGPEPAVNAVFANKIAAIDDPDERAAFIAEQLRVYEEDVDLLRLASRARRRRRGAAGRPPRRGHRPPRPRRRARTAHFSERRHGVPPGLASLPMPWCDDCAKFWNPNSLPKARQLPDLRVELAEPGCATTSTKAPWHFKLLVAMRCRLPRLALPPAVRRRVGLSGSARGGG